MSAKNETLKMARFIQENCPREVGEETPVDVAMRVLARLAHHAQSALLELGVPTADYPAPLANAVEHLTTGLGEWGKQ